MIWTVAHFYHGGMLMLCCHVKKVPTCQAKQQQKCYFWLGNNSKYCQIVQNETSHWHVRAITFSHYYVNLSKIFLNGSNQGNPTVLMRRDTRIPREIPSVRPGHHIPPHMPMLDLNQDNIGKRPQILPLCKSN